MSFDNLMKAVARNNQLGELDFRDNRYYLTIDSRIEFTCFQANGRFFIHGVIAQLPPGEKDRENILRNLMTKTVGLATTQRVILSIEPEKDALALHFSCPLQGMDDNLVEEALAEFANNFEYYLKEISQEQTVMPTMPTMIMP
ncbi:CesT family type III secretion system chaperone [Endozoicomonas sp. 8E]|uniref:CesT family type III secretion system chaperone n=1 Tax=Endozoicomonas sp. 8E TaxID=3035692 RepID=UPI002938E38D|nr:CesT family type III secretion system chaperone [Endozoicomonas sp. 8E]WOG25695.1 CesT family type III secretion system chaperone [Endozoicomonas sp. 8E]